MGRVARRGRTLTQASGHVQGLAGRSREWHAPPRWGFPLWTKAGRVDSRRPWGRRELTPLCSPQWRRAGTFTPDTSPGSAHPLQRLGPQLTQHLGLALAAGPRALRRDKEWTETFLPELKQLPTPETHGAGRRPWPCQHWGLRLWVLNALG